MTRVPRRASRREFLKGKAALDAVTDRLDEVPASSSAEHKASGAADALGASGIPQISSGAYLIQFARRAMACQFEIYLNARQYENGSEAALEALDLVEQLEDQLTVYRDHSEISQLNRTAADRPVAVEPRLFELLALAVDLHRQTKGAFDITAGPLSKIWGFTRRAGAIPTNDELAASLDLVGSQHLQLDAEQHTVAFLRHGVSINLGAIGKGYALDRCAEQLTDAGIDDVLLHGGNSSVLARGSHAATPRQGWSIGVRNPLRPEQRLGELRVVDQALATSGSGSQFFIHEGQRYGHILDPRTGWPAQGVLSTTVIAPTAALADALSTALYVMGPDEAVEFCREHEEIAALMVCPGEKLGELKMYGWNIPPNQWHPITDR
jgi:FAD:protein FMN transferase